MRNEKVLGKEKRPKVLLPASKVVNKAQKESLPIGRTKDKTGKEHTPEVHQRFLD